MLDGQTFNGVGVVAAPDLGEVGQHTGVKAAAAAGTALKQHVGEGGGQPVQQPVDAQHVPVCHFALPFRRQRTAVYIGHVAVHVPFHIFNMVVAQKITEHLGQVIHHFVPAKVQHQLVPAHGGVASGPSHGGPGTDRNPH